MTQAILTDWIALVCFAFAILHSFSVSKLLHYSRSLPKNSFSQNFFKLMGEVELVFGLWSLVYLFFFAVRFGFSDAISYIEGLSFQEPLFVFVILSICSTRPILYFAHLLVEQASKLLPFKRSISFYAVTLTLGPCLGSLITEPAAMTVTALILVEHFYKKGISDRFKYATLGLLFVNVSICGTLTPYAAPPVLMVARQWNWGLLHMLSQFGWKGLLAASTSTAIVAFRFRDEIQRVKRDRFDEFHQRVPSWLQALHLFFLATSILTAHHPVLCIGVLLLFLGLVTVTGEFQDTIQLRQGLLVAFFLGGLIILGTPQKWWLEPLLSRMTSGTLFLGSTILTAFVDNAALTFLGSQVNGLSEVSRYALVAGSVVGGGLTIIANAPNPAGYGILNPCFGKDGINPFYLFTHAIVPTLIAGFCFWVF